MDDAYYLREMSDGSDWTVHLWFKNFLLTYEREYWVCNWTCLLGEVGGNLGFFLGGSIVAYMDRLINPLIAKMKE